MTSLPEYFEVAHELGLASTTQRLWFRGVNNAGHALIPRLYRDDREAKQLLEVEQDMLAEFKARSRPLLSTQLASDWEYLFVMQHYGVPTRLLDWSENALFALYFALSVAAKGGFPTDAAVWVLDPAGWNCGIFPGMQSPGKALHADDSALKNYEPGRELDGMAEQAVAMYALYNNPRIVAQRAYSPYSAVGRIR